ncbi:MAG: inner membrane CreD family protein [Sphingomonadales bacterium]
MSKIINNLYFKIGGIVLIALLLTGSIGVFIILGLVMYLSRKIDWYNLNQQNPEA